MKRHSTAEYSSPSVPVGSAPTATEWVSPLLIYLAAWGLSCCAGDLWLWCMGSLVVACIQSTWAHLVALRPMRS